MLGTFPTDCPCRRSALVRHRRANLVHLAQHTEIMLICRTDCVLDNLSVQGDPGMKFEAIHWPRRTETVAGSAKFASWGLLEGQNGEGFGIDNDEVQFLNFGGELFDHQRQPGESDVGLGFRGPVWVVVDVEQSPSAAEVRHLEQLLKERDRQQVCVGDFLIRVQQFRWDVWVLQRARRMTASGKGSTVRSGRHISTVPIEFSGVEVNPYSR